MKILLYPHFGIRNILAKMKFDEIATKGADLGNHWPNSDAYTSAS